MDLSELQSRLDELKAEWIAAQPLEGERQERWRQKLRLEWNYNSNHIEGNTLTYGETRQLILKGVAVGNHTLREYEEMKAHDVAIEYVSALAADPRPITEADVRDLNRILLKEPFWKDAKTADGRPSRKQILPGQYKTTPNNVVTASGETFDFAPPEDTPAQMQELMEWFRSQLEEGTAIVPLIAAFHHRFSVIHPFDDGNGRTMRLLVNYALLRRGYPPIIVRSADKARYLGALNAADAGNLEEFAIYLGTALEEALELGLRASRGESLEEPEDWQKEMTLLVRRHGDNQKPAPVASWWSVKKLADSSWRPLFDETIAKLGGLRKVFNEIKVEVAAPNESDPKAVVDWMLSRDKEIAEMIFEPGASSSRYSYPRAFAVKILFRGFSSPEVEPFDVWTYYRFDLAKYRYTIFNEFLRKPILNLRYDTPLSEETRGETSSAVAKGLFQAVKREIEKNTINTD